MKIIFKTTNDNNMDDVKSDLKAAFELLDKDKSGFISKEELKDAMKNLGENITDEEIEAFCLETNINGAIGFDEFVMIMLN